MEGDWRDWLAPTRAELDREEHENEMYRTYETRYAMFCREHHLDPEDGRSVLIYEEEWEEEYEHPDR